MTLPQELLVSTLLRARVQDHHGVDHGTGHQVWMHPPAHRVLGWASCPTSFGTARSVWRLNQLGRLQGNLAVVSGTPSQTEQSTLDLLPTLMGAHLYSQGSLAMGRLVDAVVNLKTGAIGHYLVARNDPRLPGTSRWRLEPTIIVDQQPGQVVVAVDTLDDLPLARAGLGSKAVQTSQHWRGRFQETTAQVGQQLEDWLQNAPWPQSHHGDIPPPRRQGQRDIPGEHNSPAGAGGSEWEVWDAWEHPPHRQPSSPHQDREMEEPDQKPWL